MKIMRNMLIIGAAALMVAGVQAELLYTFDTTTEGFGGFDWVAGPAGWADGPVIQAQSTGGWWQPAGKEFNFEAGGGVADQQVEMQNIANSGLGMVEYDLLIDANSVIGATWFSTVMVGNSGDAGSGWTQIENTIPMGWHNGPTDTVLYVFHVEHTFAELGYVAGNEWFQLIPIVNSGDPVKIYLDNVKVSQIPEPATLGLLAIGGLSVFIRRRLMK